MQNILVTGGTGFLGAHLIRTLLEKGHTVRILGRDFSRVETSIAQGALPVKADLRDRAAIQSACKGVEGVFHVGALSAPWGKRSDFFEINVGGTEAIIEGCRIHNVRRLVYVSSPSVIFDGKDHHNAREDMPYPARFASIYSLTKKLGEDLINQAPSELETVILRPKAIFGPGDQSLLPRLIAAARDGRLPQIGDGQNRVDLTYVENVVDALMLAMETQAAAGKTYTITNNEHALLWEVIREVLQKLGLSMRLRQIPLSVALTAASLMELRAALTGKEPLMTRYSAAILGRTQTYDISAAQRDLGYTPRISIAEGTERTLESLKVNE